MTDRFRAACFDLDGTLVDTEPIHVEAERLTLLHFGVEPAPDHPRNFGIGVEAGMATLAASYGLGDPHRVMAVYVPLWEWLLDARLKAMSGALTLLAALNQAAVPLALVTSGDDEYARLVLHRLGITDLFAHTVTGDDVSEMKPSPEPYLLAADRLGFPPELVVAFEDSVAGVASVVAAGMYCIAVASDVHERSELAAVQLSVASLTEFGPPEIQRLFVGGPVGH